MRRSLLLVACAGALGALALGVATASGDTAPPVSTDIPYLHGSPGVGKTLTTTDGTWSTSATFTYQWLRCNAVFVKCADIAGATAASYTARTADIGHVLAARVTATNAAGSAAAVSSGKGLVEARPPGAEGKPWIRGTKRVGKTLSVLGPHWTRSASSYTQQWLRCSSKGNACVRITGTRKICYPQGECVHESIGTYPSYKLTASDLGHRIRVRAVAWNGAGRAASTSAPTRIVTR